LRDRYLALRAVIVRRGKTPLRSPFPPTRGAVVIAAACDQLARSRWLWATHDIATAAACWSLRGVLPNPVPP